MKAHFEDFLFSKFKGEEYHYFLKAKNNEAEYKY